MRSRFVRAMRGRQVNMRSRPASNPRHELLVDAAGRRAGGAHGEGGECGGREGSAPDLWWQANFCLGSLSRTSHLAMFFRSALP